MHTCTYINVHTYMYIVHCLPLSPEKWDRGQVTGYRGQVTEDRLQRTSDKSPRPLATIRVVILKFFKTILRPWQAVVLKNFGPTLYSFSKKQSSNVTKKTEKGDRLK